MGLRDRLTGGGDGGRAPLDHYELMYSTDGGSFKQAHVDTDLDVDLHDIPKDQPLSEDGVKETAEVEGWPGGYYALKERMEDNTYGTVEWRFEYENENESADDDLDPVERALVNIDERLRELEGSGAITSPDEAYGEVFSRILEGDEMAAASAEQLREFLREWRAVTQGAPSEPGEFAGRLAQDRYEAGDQEGATKLLDAWFAADSAGDGGSLLGKALEGDVSLEGDVGLLELAGLDAYTRMEPALDRLAEGLGNSAADAVEGGAGEDLIASALSSEGGGRRRDRREAVDADDRDEPPDEAPAESNERRPRRSRDEVASLSDGFDGPTASADESDSQSESTDEVAAPIHKDEATEVAVRAAEGD